MNIRPRSFAASVLKPREAVRISIVPPLAEHEEGLVMTLEGVQCVDIDERAADHYTIRNKAEKPIPYFFVVVPVFFIKILKADWKALRVFLASLKALADARGPVTAAPPQDPPPSS